jgi:hypothetical protein
MQIREFHKPITSKQLNESLAKKFGYKINFEQFNDVQLEDARNKLRTRLSQLELSESFDSVIESPTYQKTRLMLDCINQEILEREMTPAEKSKEADIKKKVDPSGMKASMKKQYGEDKGENVYFATIRKRAMSESVPEKWIDGALKRFQLGESDKAELKAELQVRYDINESKASWMLMEGEEAKAETIMATKDMVDRITGWLEDVAAMKAEQLLELTDSIRETQGSDVAQQWQDSVKPALEAVYTALETSRTGLSSALAIVSGGEAPTTMGAPTGGMDSSLGGATADLGAPPDMSGTEEPELAAPSAEVGREKRESVDYSRRLGMLLASKKK